MTIRNVSQQERKAIIAVIKRCENMYGAEKTRIVFNNYIVTEKKRKKLLTKKRDLQKQIKQLDKKKRA